MTITKLQIFNIPPLEEESPAKYAERLGIFYTSQMPEEHKKKKGQYFTSYSVAKFMADYNSIEKEEIRILDPGSGIGILSISLVEELILKRKCVQTIEIVAFETDVNILPYAENAYKYLSIWLKKREVELKFYLCKNDFILHNSLLFSSSNNSDEIFDIVISNPPYFKLPNLDERAIIARPVIYGQTNIYSIFLLIATKLLKENGQLIFITPRSFCSGKNFRLFREIFFSIVNLEYIHIFKSRKAAFKKDNILQENVIISANKKQRNDENQIEIPFVGYNEIEVEVSNSVGINDVLNRRKKKYKLSSLINFSTQQKILHLPSTELDETIIDIFKSWSGSLNMYGLEISTGPVVDFRSKEVISQKKLINSVPLIWLHNIDSMKFTWPINTSKGKLKGQYIIKNEKSISKLVKNKNYVLIRRFSTKDDSKRLIAAAYLKRDIHDIDMIGIENHLNYIYHKKRELSIEETIGLAAIFNSRLFDLYFRTFNGNINVSATELRNFPLPDFNLIQLLGKKIKVLNRKNIFCDIDNLILKTFKLSIDLSKTYE